jgi:NAD(P)-dependent dehydrogenase (short-subunit alcohol dehydrogenase family)
MTGKVAIVSGASAGIGAGLVAGYWGQGWAVVAFAHTIEPSADPHVLTVTGDVAEPETADHIVGEALGRFGRIDTLVNNAGVFISKPLTDYTTADYALAVGVNLTGSFWLTQRAIAEMATRCGGHVVSVLAAPGRGRGPRRPRSPRHADQRWPGRGHSVAGHQVRLIRHPGQCRLARRHPQRGAPAGKLRRRRPAARARAGRSG